MSLYVPLSKGTRIASDLDAAGVDAACRQHAAETQRPWNDGVEDVGRSKLCA